MTPAGLLGGPVRPECAAGPGYGHGPGRSGCAGPLRGCSAGLLGGPVSPECAAEPGDGHGPGRSGYRAGVSPRLGACCLGPARRLWSRLVLRGHPCPSPLQQREPAPGTMVLPGRSRGVGRGHGGVSPQDEARPRPPGPGRTVRAEPRRHSAGAPPHPVHSWPAHPAPPAFEARGLGRSPSTPGGSRSAPHTTAQQDQWPPRREPISAPPAGPAPVPSAPPPATARTRSGGGH